MISFEDFWGNWNGIVFDSTYHLFVDIHFTNFRSTKAVMLLTYEDIMNLIHDDASVVNWMELQT